MLYAPRANEPSPLVKQLNNLEESTRDALLRRLRGEQQFLDEFGQNGARQANRLSSAWAESGTPAERGLFYFMAFTPSKMPFTLYVAVEDGVPVLLHLTRNYGDRRIHGETSEAAKRLRNYRDVQLERVAASNPDRVSDERPTAAAVFSYTVTERYTPPATESERVNVELSGPPFEIHKFEEAKVRMLIGLRQEVASRYQRVVSNREPAHQRLLEQANEKLAASERTHEQAESTARGLRANLKQLSRFSLREPAKDDPAVGGSSNRPRRIANALRSLFGAGKPGHPLDQSPLFERTQPSPEALAALEENFNVALAREQQSAETLMEARAAFRRWRSVDIWSLEVTPLDESSPETLTELAALKKRCPEMRKLAIEIGTRILEESEFSIPIVREALGNLPSTGRGKKLSPSSKDQLALLAADIVCFHVLHGLPLDGSVPAYGAHQLYPAGEPSAIRDEHVRHVNAAQHSKLTRAVVPGAGLDATFGELGSPGVLRIEQLVITGTVAPNRTAAKELVASATR